MNNKIIRMAMTEYDVRQWQLAFALDISESALSRKLRNELPADEQARIVNIIKQKWSGNK